MSNRLFVGLLAAGLSLSLGEACHPTGGTMTGSAGSGSTGSGGTGTGNTTGSAGSGSGNTSGNAGTTGTGNDTGAAGSGTAGSTTGAGGSAGDTGAAGNTGTGNSTGAAGTGVIADMIDNLDDADGRIIMANSRQEPWHSFNDSNGGNQQPPIGTGFLPVSGGANSTSHAVHTTGSGYQFGGVGFDLNNPTTAPESAQSQGYNASAYNGISFWAKGSGTLRVEFAMRSFVPTDRGGTCASGCWNIYGATTPTLTSNWQLITIAWAGMQREQGGTSPAFNPSELMGVAFKAGGTFDFWIDEVAFTRAGGTTGAAGTTGSAGRGGTTGMAGTTGSAGRGGTTGSAGAGTTGAAGTGQGGTGNVGTEPMPPQITSGGMN